MKKIWFLIKCAWVVFMVTVWTYIGITSAILHYKQMHPRFVGPCHLYQVYGPGDICEKPYR